MKTQKILEANIGANIKAYREGMRLRQEDIASYLNVQREVISYYENGTREISMENLKKLSDLFGVDLHDLIEENYAMKTANVSFAFRAEGLSTHDLNVISEFKKIVKNYLKISELREKNER